MEKVDVAFLIVGGGISGLSFAKALQTKQYLIVEAQSDVGGYCQTIKQDGFVWDYSGHFFHFRHPHIEKELVSRIGKENIVKVEKNSKIYYGGELVDFPFQKNIHQLPKSEFIECLTGLFSRADEPPTNFKEMLYSKFGNGISEKFLVPYNEKLYAVDIAKLDINAMGRFFPYADIEDIVKNFSDPDTSSYNSHFTYPKGGAIEYVRAIQQDVSDKNILLNQKVNKIDPVNKFAYTQDYQISFKHIVSSIPFPTLLEICNIQFSTAVYNHNKVLVFNLGFDSKGLSGVHWVYYPQEDICFYRIGYYDNIFMTDRMSLYVEIGLPADFVFEDDTIENFRRKVLNDLKANGVVQNQNLISHHSIVLDPAYVHITEGSNSDVETKKSSLATQGIYSIGRYGSWTYCSIEDNIVEARNLADKFNAFLAG